MLFGSRPLGQRAFPLVIALSVLGLAACSSAGSGGSTSSGTTGVTSALAMPGPTGPLESTSITVESVPTADEAGLYIASDKGYFAKEGLNVKVVPTGGGELSIADLNDGKAQLAAGNYVSYVQAQIAGTANLRLIANGSQMQPGNQGLYVLPNSKFKSVADLTKFHATIGVNTSNNIGSLLIDSLLKDNGLNPSELKPLYVPNPKLYPNAFGNVVTELQQGKIDAGWLPEPFATQAEQEFGAVKLADFDSASLTSFPIGVYAGTEAWVQAHPNTIAAFLRGLQAGQEEADTDRNQVEQSLVKNTLVPNGVPLAAAQQLASLMTLDTYPLTMDVPQMQRVSNVMYEFGLEPAGTTPYSISSMVQPEPGMVTHGGGTS
ncbi:MAG TPA: ABC transporter substrate-binding protein [Trebonia sp.]|jgi:NitT/TauT family transport system substrate-binding protein|nr:ABC transporter substrate-binding protein [Trebonia sp.]